MKTKKKSFPFLIGTTSYIVPDDIVPNVRLLAPLIDDVELVLFESPDASNIPSDDCINSLVDIGLEHGLGYTVHLPIDKKAGAKDRSERTKFRDAALRVIDSCSELYPRAWIIHLEGVENGASKTVIGRWAERCGAVLSTICSHIGDPSLIAIENIGYPWHWHEVLSARHKTSLCCDVGHLWMHHAGCWKGQLEAMLPRTAVIHLHGVADGKDHVSLADGEVRMVTEFFGLIKKHGYEGVITLEVFNECDFAQSMEMTEVIWEELH